MRGFFLGIVLGVLSTSVILWARAEYDPGSSAAVPALQTALVRGECPELGPGEIAKPPC